MDKIKIKVKVRGEYRTVFILAFNELKVMVPGVIEGNLEAKYCPEEITVVDNNPEIVKVPPAWKSKVFAWFVTCKPIIIWELIPQLILLHIEGNEIVCIAVDTLFKETVQVVVVFVFADR